MKAKLRELARNCFEGELTLRKTTLWLIGAACLLGGIVYGLKTAPVTHRNVVYAPALRIFFYRTVFQCNFHDLPFRTAHPCPFSRLYIFAALMLFRFSL